MKTADERAWHEFYDAAQADLRLAELDAEFERLWGHEGSARGADPRTEEEALDEKAREFEGGDLSSLRHAYRPAL
jgi:hypothetical protein